MTKSWVFLVFLLVCQIFVQIRTTEATTGVDTTGIDTTGVATTGVDTTGVESSAGPAPVIPKITLRIEGNVSTFMPQQFTTALAAILNISPNRIIILNITSGSVIINFNIQPPAANSNEPTAVEAAQNLVTQVNTNPQALTEAGINVLEITVDIPGQTLQPTQQPTQQPNQMSSPEPILRSGPIAGIVIGGAAFLIIVVVVIIVLVTRRKRTSDEEAGEVHEMKTKVVEGSKTSSEGTETSEEDDSEEGSSEGSTGSSEGSSGSSEESSEGDSDDGSSEGSSEEGSTTNSSN